MRLLIAAVVRLVVLGAALAAYYATTPLLFPDAGDANIGAGLIAFGVAALVSLGWAFADGRRRGAAPALAVWALVALAFGVLWALGLAAVGTDDSATLPERIRLDAFLGVFTAGLVLLPAAAGAALGASTHRRQD
jgi:hypothetical protein